MPCFSRFGQKCREKHRFPPVFFQKRVNTGKNHIKELLFCSCLADGGCKNLAFLFGGLE